MNIKSLLLGSAAALVAVSGARAADAVMAPEPEPVEYVRVCDAYGAGFFYIPGTETCLQISGYVWFQVGAGSFQGNTLNAAAGPFFASIGTESSSAHYGVTAQDGWRTSVRARVNFDARSETELGTLRSYIRLQADWNGVGDGPVGIDQAYIELGGFKMGYSESFWVDSGNGPGSNYGSHSWTGMSYGYQQRALIGYRFESNGFFGAISLEDDALAGNGYLPDVVAKLGYSGGWGTVWVKAAYDESFDGSSGGPLGPLGYVQNGGGWAAQIGAQINVPNMPGSSLRLIASWADGAHAFNNGGPTNTVAYGLVPPFNILFPGFPNYAGALFGGAEWNILASYNQQFSETFGASLGFQWFDNLYIAGTDIKSGVDAWQAELSFVWFPVRQFEVRGELAYTDVGAIAPGLNPEGSVSGFLRFTRYF